MILRKIHLLNPHIETEHQMLPVGLFDFDMSVSFLVHFCCGSLFCLYCVLTNLF